MMVEKLTYRVGETLAKHLFNKILISQIYITYSYNLIVKNII